MAAMGGARTSRMLLTVPFALVGIFRYKLLSDPEEAERRRERTPEQSSKKPEEIPLGDRGIKLTLMGWLMTTAVVGLISRGS
jgi:decaprenyl-phosphate phosphoribosyltransferase